MEKECLNDNYESNPFITIFDILVSDFYILKLFK